MSRSTTDEEKAKVQKLVDEIYRDFVGKVAKGRKMSYETALGLAEGKVYTGRQAKQNNLIDEIGGLEEAINKARQLAGIGQKPDLLYMRGNWGMWNVFLGFGPALWDYDFDDDFTSLEE